MLRASDDGCHALVSAEGATWTPPDRLPDAQDLRRAIVELERGLTPAGSVDIGRHIDRLGQLTAQRGRTVTSWATVAAEYARLLGEHASDVWARAVDGWLMTPERGQWFPTIAELGALMSPVTAERRTRLKRCRAMLARTSLDAPKLRESSTIEERIATVAAAKRMYGLRDDQSLRSIIDPPPRPRTESLKPLYVWHFEDGRTVLATECPPGAVSLREWNERQERAA